MTDPKFKSPHYILAATTGIGLRDPAARAGKKTATTTSDSIIGPNLNFEGRSEHPGTDSRPGDRIIRRTPIACRRCGFRTFSGSFAGFVLTSWPEGGLIEWDDVGVCRLRVQREA